VAAEWHLRDDEHDRLCWDCSPGGASLEEDHSGGYLAEGVAELVRLARVGFGGQVERREAYSGCGVRGKRLLPGEYRLRGSLQISRDLVGPRDEAASSRGSRRFTRTCCPF
jgi:hypothetical protein